MEKFAYIALGGAAGSVLRYLVHGAVQRWSGSMFPWGTFAVNISGCLLIGLLAGLFAGPYPAREEIRLGILVGILGGYTTFSTFGLDTLVLADNRRYGLAAANMLSSCAVGLLAVWLGARLVQRP